MSFWTDKRVFLTGDTGFKGSWLAIWLTRLGARVSGYALPPPTRPSLFEAARVGELIDHKDGDIRDAEGLAAAMIAAKPEILIHMAAQSLVRPSYEDPLGTFATNVMGTAHVLDAMRRVPSLRVGLMITSDKCYENREWVYGYRETDAMGGFDPYSSSKGCAELVTAAWRRSFLGDRAVASARAGNVIGGGDWAADRLVPDLARALVRGESPIIRNPRATRPWQHVLDPLAGYMTLCQRLWDEPAAFSDGWNFGPLDDDAKPVAWIADTVCREWGDGANWTLQQAGQAPHEAHLLKLDCSKARAELGWSGRWHIADALAHAVGWYKAFGVGADARSLCFADMDAFDKVAAP
ncbi:CDP-glucose 4,6-dehydratase [Paramagnetospirillum kuznetsovii]|uniref:CDP-glucose 4,6-dehydratase n=1 Tax=Paramagnetospirillum kuznetsovii TaxID=2053833 RepID=A0A364P2U7_9PROT|nr:CDP-glucose 4,6-dehydratase [Paramagnetospirillum kuznetsovii]RAU23590.1 CDP-glucose 4,6-dehydratase [Paramagnetospirillum kuznetsovii]